MPSRSKHHKSRHGCAECKQRRVKCDEVQPRCSNCARRATKCTYHSMVASLRPENDAGRQQPFFSACDTSHDAGQVRGDVTALPTGCTIDVTVASNLPLNMVDLELLMHWKDSTYQTFCRDSQMVPIWQSFVPQEALAEPFLMHGILALSAVHLARTKGEDRRKIYMYSAESHQNQALTKFRRSLEDINPSNSKAIFAFASLLVVYSFGSLQVADSPDQQMPIDKLCQVIVLARGVHEILARAADSLQDSLFQPLLGWDCRASRLPEEANIAFEHLHEKINSFATVHTRSQYLEAAACVRDGVAEVLGGCTAVAVATRVAIRMPVEFTDLLREHDPLGLVILAYFCNILHRLRHNWCLDNWGVQVADAIWSRSDGHWRNLMHWPLRDILAPSSPSQCKTP